MGIKDPKIYLSDNGDLIGTSSNEETLPREVEKPKAKPRVRKTEQQQILEELKNIRRLLAFPLKRYNVENANDAKFIERMNK